MIFVTTSILIFTMIELVTDDWASCDGADASTVIIQDKTIILPGYSKLGIGLGMGMDMSMVMGMGIGIGMGMGRAYA